MRLPAILLLFAVPLKAETAGRAPELRDITPDAVAAAPLPAGDIQPAPAAEQGSEPVIYSADRKWLNTGTMLAPKFWKGPPAPSDVSLFKDTVLDEQLFGGLTTDD